MEAISELPASEGIDSVITARLRDEGGNASDNCRLSQGNDGIGLAYRILPFCSIGWSFGLPASCAQS